jgi:S-adenosylmethionine:tRNA ribosyltransferase-isomerase
LTQVSDFNYELPEELIAQEPPAQRGDSRMLVVSRSTQTFEDDAFANFYRYLRPDDCLVLNNTRVFPARLHGTKTGTTTQVEVFLTRALNQDESDWLALVRPGRRLRVGDRVEFANGLNAEILDHGRFGERVVRLRGPGPLRDLLDRAGQVPLPPYIHRQPVAADRERYQTVYADQRGSVAAPTAGLHFTPLMLEQCRAAGAAIAYVTLHVGLGTFAPLRSSTVEEIRLHSEPFRMEESEAEKIRRARRVFCIGTTSVRAVESASATGTLAAGAGETDLFIHPGYRFRAAGALLTNFHLPQSSLLMLVAAFAGLELTLAAYRHAVAQRYRFFSYGDCMLIE